MSTFIIRDRLGPAVGVFNQRLAIGRRFKAAWPHSTSLYDERLVYYENGVVLDTYEFNRFLNIMGMKRSDLEDQDYDEIESCWFYLKPPTTKNAVFTNIEMVDAMGTETPKNGETISIKFRYAGGLAKRLVGDSYEAVNTYDVSGDIRYDETKAMEPWEIQAEIMSDPGKYVMSQMSRAGVASRNHYMSAYGDDYDFIEKTDSTGHKAYKKKLLTMYEEPVCQIVCDTKYGWYALFDDTNFNFNQIDTTTPVMTPFGTPYGFEWTVRYKVIKDLVYTNPCVTTFEPIFNERADLQKVNGSLPSKITEADFRVTAEVTDSDVWPNGRLSVPRSDAMKRVDFVDMIGTCIDSDYEVEDPNFWEKLFAVVIIVAAVVVTIVSCGTAAGLAWPAAMAAIGFAFAMGAIVLGIGSALLGYFGGPSASNMVKIISGVAQYMGIISSVLGIFSFIGNFIKKMSSEAILKAAAKEAAKAAKAAGSKAAGKAASELIMNEATALASSSAFKRATTVALESAVNAISFAGDSIGEVAKKLTSWTQDAFTIYRYYDENFGEMASLNEANEELRTELEDLNEQNAPSKSMMFGQDVYVHSFGSFDAIAEINIKMDKQCGGWYADQDPCASIT